MSQNFIISVNAVFPLLICMAAGYLFRWLGLVDEAFCHRCNTFCFKTFLPLMIFMNIYDSDMESAVQPAAFAFSAASVLTVFLLAWLLVPRLIPRDATDSHGRTVPAASRQAVLIQAIFRGNFVIFGVPVVANIYGTEKAAVASVMAAVIVPLFNVLAVITLESHSGTKKGLRPLLRGIAKNPLIWGAVLGFLFKLSGIPLPAALHKGLSNMASIATPLSLVALGGTFYFKALRPNARELCIGVVGKLVLAPLLTIPPAVLLGFRNEVLLAMVIVVASPTAVNSYTMAAAYGHDPELAGQQVVMTSVFSLVSVFAWIFLLRSFGLLA